MLSGLEAAFLLRLLSLVHMVENSHSTLLGTANAEPVDFGQGSTQGPTNSDQVGGQPSIARAARDAP